MRTFCVLMIGIWIGAVVVLVIQCLLIVSKERKERIELRKGNLGCCDNDAMKLNPEFDYVVGNDEKHRLTHADLVQMQVQKENKEGKEDDELHKG